MFPTGEARPLPPYTGIVEDWPVAGLILLGLLLVAGWLVGRKRITRVVRTTPEERLAGYTAALSALGLVAVLLALFKPYALIFVLPSLYTWLWLPLRSRFWPRVAIYAAGWLGPVVGLLVLSRELAIDFVDAPLYVVGLATVGYLSPASVAVALVWGAIAAQLAALALGRYAPYAGGAEPPPVGPVRDALSRAAGATRRRYGRRR
jgi:hypothetical protein